MGVSRLVVFRRHACILVGVIDFSRAAVIFNYKLSRIFLINCTAFCITGKPGYTAALSRIQRVPFTTFWKKKIQLSFCICLCSADPFRSGSKTNISFWPSIHANRPLQICFWCPDCASVLIHIDKRPESFRGADKIPFFLILFDFERTAANTKNILLCFAAPKRFVRFNQVRKWPILWIINIRWSNRNSIIASNHIYAISFWLIAPIPLHKANCARLDCESSINR